MSFTADIYKSILRDIAFAEANQPSPFAMRLVKFDNDIMVAFAVNIATRMRSAFLSVTSEVPKSKFPHWKGVEIETVTLPAYGIDTPFVGLSQLPNSASDIFEIVVEDLRTQLESAENTEESLSVIIRVLIKWKEFFAADKELLMSEKRQQGLYGELLFLSECLDSQGPSAVLHWAGCEDEVHDFYFGPHAVEVKTTSAQAPYFASISSEYQLDNDDIPGKLFLRFYALRKSHSGGEKLPERISAIRSKLCEDISVLQKFDEKLKKYGYFDEAADNYIVGYYQRDRYCFTVENDFPKLTKEAVPLGVADLTYRVSIMLCMPYAQDINSVFEVLRGGA
ncbi:PD-(D/E)XK motif protein [Megasphaera hexanoica]|uniref:PD-(D/E)XK motif protein n=1 Tax=Megasphaera sp. SW808 TaxID=2530045 RepID=UPI00143946D0|nr:PD-(D/E)XK motif protein [Megasphaera sp. SW808]MDN0047180.1 PD-(D/E)XK motif protein [Megasphaera hexanoica]